jgi:hypothetical protein
MRISFVPIIHCEKMAVTDIFRQRAVIEFLVKDESFRSDFVVCIEMVSWVSAVSEGG